MSNIKFKYGLLEKVKDEYELLPQHYREELEKVCVEYLDIIDDVVKNQRYEEAARMRDEYRERIQQRAIEYLWEWKLYNEELQNYTKNENNS